MGWDICVDELIRLNLFVELCRGALDFGVTAKEMVDLQREALSVLRRPDPYPNEDAYKSAIEHAEKVEEFSKDEKCLGHPYLYSIAVTKIWTILESGIDDLALECIKSLDKCTDIDLIRGLKGPLLDFYDATDDERNEYLITELKLAVKASLKPGVGRFEAILKPLGLGGEVHEKVRKVLFELSQIRNLIIHKRSIVDKKFKSACPWLTDNLGDNFYVTKEVYLQYFYASFWYVLELDRRYDLRQGKDSDHESILNKFLSRISDPLQNIAGETQPTAAGDGRQD